MKKVMILVLSARRTPWASLMDTQMATWDAVEHPDTQTFYYCGQSSLPSTEKVFYSRKYSESLEDITPRTIEALEHALNWDWEYMARTHSSTYVHKKNLVDYIETLPTENVLSGLITTGEKPFLWGGGSYIISRDVVEKLVEAKDRWNLKIMEDVSLTDIANELQIPMCNGRMAAINKTEEGWLVITYNHGENFPFKEFDADFAKRVEGHYYFRVKQDLQRHLDLEIMKELKRVLP